MVCAVVGLIVGGFVPALWGASTLGFRHCCSAWWEGLPESGSG